MQQGVYQRAGMDAASGMHGHARRLIDYHQIVILVKRLQVDILGLSFERAHWSPFRLDLIAGLQMQTGPRDDQAIDAHQPFFDQVLNARAAQLDQMCGEVLVQATLGFTGRDREAMNVGRH